MAERTASLDQRTRDLALAAAATAAVLLVTQFVVRDGTPVAILLQGLTFGLTNALIAVGLVLIYRSHRVINFAQAAMGVFGGVFTFDLATLSGWPFLLAFAAGVLVAGGVGLAFQLAFVLRFFNAPRLILTVLTIVLIQGLQQVVPQIRNLPIFPDEADRTEEALLGRGITLPFEDFDFRVGGLPTPFGFGHLFALGMATLALIGLFAFFRYTRMGVAVRAAAENAERASLLGISVAKLSMVVWTIAGLLAGLGVILNGAVTEVFSPGVVPPELIIIPLAAAVLARFDSFPLATLAAVLLTVLRQSIGFGYEGQLPLTDALLLGVVLAGLLLHRRRAGRSEEQEATAFESAQEQRPIPRELLAVPSIGLTRRVLIGVVVGGLLLFPLVGTPGQINQTGFLLLVSISIVSLVVLTGWAGQVSLGQFAFVAIGAVVGGALTARLGISFWIAIFLVPFITAGLTLVMGVPALRIKGLFLGVVTFAFAIAVESVLFQEQYFGWLLPGAVERPALFFLDFEDNRSMYYLNLVALSLSVLLVYALRRSRPGRILIGLRENENNLRSFGVNPVRMRLTAFAISGFLCGIAGVFLAHHQRAVASADFMAATSLNVFVFAVVGGVGSIGGALLGAAYFSATFLIFQSSLGGNQLLVLVIGPLGILIVLYVAPGGLASLLARLRDGVLKIVAQRRQMVVPALYQDVDPEALRRRLIPLASPIPNAGLDALPYELRYAAESELYGGRGRVTTAEDGPDREDEAAAFSAAADRAEEDEESVPATGEDRG